MDHSLSWQRGLCDSMTLRATPCKATQDKQVSVESSDNTRSTGEGNGSPLQHSCLEKQGTVWKGKKIRPWNMSPQVEESLCCWARAEGTAHSSGKSEGAGLLAITQRGWWTDSRDQAWEGAWGAADRGLQDCMGSSDQNLAKEKETQEGNVAVWGSSQISEKRGEKRGRKGKKPQLHAESHRTARRDKKLFKLTVQKKIKKK